MLTKIKIYYVSCYQAPMMGDTGEGYSLEPWSGDDRNYTGEDDGGVVYDVPDGVGVFDGTYGRELFEVIGLSVPVGPALKILRGKKGPYLARDTSSSMGNIKPRRWAHVKSEKA